MLRTGALDDEREILEFEGRKPGDRLYQLFAWAHREQDHWTDEYHCEFWRHHLPAWGRKRGNRPNREALAFVLALARCEGFSYELMIKEMGRSRDDFRNRTLPLANVMYEVLSDPIANAPAAGMPGAEGIVGPFHPAVIAGRRWRLPRVFVEADEAALPPPLGGWINLNLRGRSQFAQPQRRMPRRPPGPVRGSFAPVGEASRTALREGYAALNRLMHNQPEKTWAELVLERIQQRSEEEDEEPWGP